MNTILTIFKKELIDTLRDRRTIIMMVVIPMLLFPVLITVVTQVMSRQVKKEEDKVLRVGLLTYGNASAFRAMLMARQDLKIREDIQADQVRGLVRADSLDAAMVFGKSFDQRIEDMKRGTINFYYKSKELNIARSRLMDFIKDFEKQLVSVRFKKLSLDEKMVDAVLVERYDIASTKEKLGKRLGGWLPYIFVLFCFMGCMYPAIDLGAGEKERGTLETLLASPADRLQILLGKFSVVVLAGLASVCVSLLGMFLAIKQVKGIPPEALDAVMSILQAEPIALTFSLLMPLTIFFAAALLSISIFAKSFKEAQSLIAPLNIVIIFPVLLGLLPGVTLDTVTAAIPVLNVSLATKEIFAGTIEIGLLVEVYASLIMLAGLSLYGCAWWFEREGTIFREV